MYNLTSDIINSWESDNRSVALKSDIEQIESALNLKLPVPYIEFVMTYGFVIFGNDNENTSVFNYKYTDGQQHNTLQQEVAFLSTADLVIKAHRILTDSSDPDDHSLPSFPKSFIPVGNDLGQGKILIESAPHHGRVWYWPESESRWGSEGNHQLGFIADDFYDFINGLQPSQ